MTKMQQPSRYQQSIPEQNLRSGIVFGPGRTTRLPDKGTPEYQEMNNSVIYAVPTIEPVTMITTFMYSTCFV